MPGTPVTVIGGFLGAGKTTLVNHLLRHATRRYAVLVNDFGSINVDASIIAGQGGGVLALTNGCVCCSIGPDFGTSLAQLLAHTPEPQHVVVEASGVSDPWRIAQLVQLEPGVALDAVLVLVDAASFPAQCADRLLADTLERQLARADLAVLNKCDVAGPALAAARAAVLRLRPGIRIAEVAHAALPEALIGGYGPQHEPPSRFRAEPPDHPFQSWAWQPARPLHRARLAAVLQALPASVLRLKGGCRLGEASAPHLLQLVGQRWSLTPWPAPFATEGLVAIGTVALPSPGELCALFEAALL